MEVRANGLEKAIDLKAMITVMIIDDRQGIEINLILFQPLNGGHDLFKGWSSPFGNPVTIMQMLRAVNGDSHQEAILSKKPRPLVINQQAIGLNAVINRFAITVTLLVLHDGLEKIQTTDGWLPPLPDKTDLRQVGLSLYLLFDVLTKRCIIHTHGHLLAIDRFLLQVKAIVTGHIALEAAWLSHDMEDGVCQNNLC